MSLPGSLEQLLQLRVNTLVQVKWSDGALYDGVLQTVPLPTQTPRVASVVFDDHPDPVNVPLHRIVWWPLAKATEETKPLAKATEIKPLVKATKTKPKTKNAKRKTQSKPPTSKTAAKKKKSGRDSFRNVSKSKLKMLPFELKELVKQLDRNNCGRKIGECV